LIDGIIFNIKEKCTPTVTLHCRITENNSDSASQRIRGTAFHSSDRAQWTAVLTAD